MKKLVVFLFFLSLYSCTLAPKLTVPKLKLPDNRTKGSKITQNWWNSYGNKQLDNIVNKALKNNDRLLLVYEKIKEAEARYSFSKASLLPQIQGNFNATRTSYPKNSYPNGILNSYIAQGTVSYEVDLFGKLNSARKAQLEQLLAQKYYAQLVKISLISNVVNTYFNLCATSEQVNIVGKIVKTQKEFVDVYNKLYLNGLSDIQTLEYAQANLSIFRENLIKLKAARRILESKLLYLMGSEPKSIFFKKIQCQKLPKPAPIPAFLPSKIINNRPDILKSLAELKAANFDVGAVEAQFFPNVDITGASGYENNKFRNLVVPSAKFWNIGLNVLAPILEFGRIKSQVKIAKSKTKEALINYIDTVKEAFLEIHNCFVSLFSAKGLMEKSLDGLKYLSNIYKIKQKKYENGLIGYGELLEAKENYLDALSKFVKAKLNYLNKEVLLYKALGGEW